MKFIAFHQRYCHRKVVLMHKRGGGVEWKGFGAGGSPFTLLLMLINKKLLSEQKGKTYLATLPHMDRLYSLRCWVDWKQKVKQTHYTCCVITTRALILGPEADIMLMSERIETNPVSHSGGWESPRWQKQWLGMQINASLPVTPSRIKACGADKVIQAQELLLFTGTMMQKVVLGKIVLLAQFPPKNLLSLVVRLFWQPTGGPPYFC